MGISRREVQGNGRKQVIELCGDMKEKGIEATRTRVLVESMKTGKWGRGRHWGRNIHTERSIYGVAGNGSQRCHVQHYLLRGDRWRKGEERPPGRGEGEAGTVRDTETDLPSAGLYDDVCEGAWAKKMEQ